MDYYKEKNVFHFTLSKKLKLNKDNLEVIKEQLLENYGCDLIGVSLPKGQEPELVVKASDMELEDDLVEFMENLEDTL